jgi:hypothetical protein
MNEPARFLDSRLPPELEERLNRELQPGEQVLWVGQPDPRKSSRPGWLFVVFGLASIGFSIGWYTHVGEIFGRVGDGFGIGQIFGLVFFVVGLFPVLTGLAMLTAPYWFARRARRCGYALTDHRALIFEAAWWWRGEPEVLTYGPDRLLQATRSENADGSGDLVIEVIEGVDSDGDATHTKRGFLTIPEVRAVEMLARRTFAAGPPT